MARLSTLALLFACLSLSQAQEVYQGEAGCTLYHVDGAAQAGPFVLADLSARLGRSTRVASQGSATFVVTYSGFDAQSQAAFQRAVDIWARHLTSAVPIRIEASFGPLAPNTLGSAGPRLIRDVAGIPPSTWYPFALADAIAGAETFNDETADIVAQFNSSFDRWYFGLDGNPANDQFDFVSVVLHEIGHGLGFVGSGDRDDGTGTPECGGGGAGSGCWGYLDTNNSGVANATGVPFIFDRFIESGNRRQFLNTAAFPNPSQSLGALLQSQDLFVNAAEVVRIYGDRAPVWAPLSFNRGSSFSHWDEIVVVGTSAALMTPRLSSGEAYQDPGDITCAFFADMGWTLGAGCRTITTDDETAPGPRLGLALDGANPFRGATALRLRLAAPGAVSIDLFDSLGRRVRTLHDGPAGADLRVVVEAGGLAPGVYHAVARTEAGTDILSVTVVQ